MTSAKVPRTSLAPPAQRALYCEIDGLPVEVDPGAIDSAGLFVETPQPAALDSEVELFLRIGEQRFVARGQVVKVVSCASAKNLGKRPGYTVLFTSFENGTRERERLSAAISTLAAPTARARRLSLRPPANSVAPARAPAGSARPRAAISGAPSANDQRLGEYRSSEDRGQLIERAADSHRAHGRAADSGAAKGRVSDNAGAAAGRASASPAQRASQEPVRRGSQDPRASHAPVKRASQDPRASHAPVKRASQDPRTSHAPIKRASQEPVRGASQDPVRRASQDPRASHAPVKHASQDPGATVKASRRAPEPAVSAEERALLTRLTDELAGLATKTPWGMLGISQGATPEELRAAFFDASKRYHPHLYARYAHPEIKRLVTELFIAHKRAYTHMLKAGKGQRLHRP